MSAIQMALLAFALVVGPPVGYVFYNAALSPDNWTYQGSLQWKDGGYHAAPGPVAGASLPNSCDWLWCLLAGKAPPQIQSINRHTARRDNKRGGYGRPSAARYLITGKVHLTTCAMAKAVSSRKASCASIAALPSDDARGSPFDGGSMSPCPAAASRINA